MKQIKRFLILLFFLLLCSGCGNQASSNQDNSEPLVSRANPQLAAEIRGIAQTVQGVSESTSVVVNKDISTAIKVKGFQRLRLESIKKEFYSKIRKKLPKDYQIYLTSDKKLYKELQRIEKKLSGKSQELSPDLVQKVRQINDDM